MPKILKPYTIIPKNLYVERDADRQIRYIIEDMARPGYVLVSRQMGKTNLLLNAKRQLEKEDDIFIYIDLSNKFESVSQCFQNIVDTILETNKHKLPNLSKVIFQERNEYISTPPHKIHLNELRFILKTISGKLVIILDEIDALIKTGYSDQIFSLIRSIYFSRITYPELENLTYLLSGVVEPTEIIKDPKISPFNIGQKIFLENFSISEFEGFIEKSGLRLTNPIKDRIFHWSNGNPRITWDLTSAIENKMMSESITSDSVDQIVKELYLLKFDKPPIDNIRNLVSNNREFQNAAISLQYNKSNAISNTLRDQLYLAGIVQINGDQLSFQNEVVKQSLSIDWIESVKAKNQDLQSLAKEYYEKEDFSNAAQYFNEILEKDLSTYPRFDYYHLGYCYLKLAKYEEAIKALEKTNFDPEDEGTLYYNTLNRLGIAYFRIGNHKMSLLKLKNGLKRSKKDKIYLRSLLNYVSFSLAANDEVHIKSVQEILTQFIKKEDQEFQHLEKEIVDELRCTAHYNLAKINIRLSENPQEAIKLYLKALELSTKDGQSVRILLDLAELENNDKHFSKASEIVKTYKQLPQENYLDDPNQFTKEDLLSFLAKCYINYRKSHFKLLLDKLNLLNANTLSESLYSIAAHCVNSQGNIQDALRILLKAYRFIDDSNYGFTKNISNDYIVAICYLSSSDTNIEFYKKFKQIYKSKSLSSFGVMEFHTLYKILFNLFYSKEYLQVSSLANKIRSYEKIIDNDKKINLLIIFNLHMHAEQELKNPEIVLRIAKRIRQSEYKYSLNQKTSLLSRNEIDQILENANNRIELLEPLLTIKNEKIGRNQIVVVRFKDGTTRSVKYKKVQDAIANKECILIEILE